MRRRSLLLAGVLGGPLARPGLAATPVAAQAGLELMITSAPSKGLISDLESDKMCMP